MFTSYFKKSSHLENVVAISLTVPKGLSIKHYKKLAPSWDILNQYKITNNKDVYIERYVSEILYNLNPFHIFEELGENSILLCYEKSGDFCHRRLVASWFKEFLNIKIEEL